MEEKEIRNPWIRFKLAPAADKAKKAFLHLVAVKNNRRKKELLDQIANQYPETVKSITNPELFHAFCRLSQRLNRQDEEISLAELDWIRTYAPSETRQSLESMIYALLLRHAHRDQERKGFCWTISVEEQRRIVNETINDKELSLRRRAELCQEVGRPLADLAAPLFAELLEYHKFRVAIDFGVRDHPNEILAAIDRSIEEECLDDALALAKEFFPENRELIAMIEKIRKIMED